MNCSVCDCISVSRIALALILFLTEPLSWQFLTVYVVAATTDVLDGRVARMSGKVNRYGSYLDSAADLVLAASVLIILIPRLDMTARMIIWMAIIAVIWGLGFAAGSLRYRKPAFVHTYMSKLTGAGLFLSPFLIILIGVAPTVLLVGIIATVASLEYLYINLSSKDYDPDCPSAFIHKAV